jgi:DNA-binding PadR family transcriptional regulator
MASRIKRLQKEVDLLSCNEVEPPVYNEPEPEARDEEDYPLQAPKISLDKVKAPKLDRRTKGAYERTEAQKAATERLKAAAILRTERIRKEKAEQEELNKKAFEEKVVQKAIAVKKKQLKQAILDEISDDDTPIEEIKQIVKQKKVTIPKPKPAPEPTEEDSEEEEVHVPESKPSVKQKPRPPLAPQAQIYNPPPAPLKPKYIFV